MSTTIYAIIERSLLHTTHYISLSTKNVDGDDLSEHENIEKFVVPHEIKEGDCIVVVRKKDGGAICSITPFSPDDDVIMNDDESAFTHTISRDSWYGVY